MKYLIASFFFTLVSCAQGDKSSSLSLSSNSAGLKRYMALIKNDSVDTYFELYPAAGMPRRPQKVSLKAFYLMSVNLENLLIDALHYNQRQIIVDKKLNVKKFDVMWKDKGSDEESRKKLETRLLDSLNAKKIIEYGERDILKIEISNKSALQLSEKKFPVKSVVKQNALFEGYTIAAMVKELNKYGLDFYSTGDTSENLYDFDINLGSSEEIAASLSKVGISATKMKAKVEIYHFVLR